MTRIHIAAAGRLREPYWKAACDEYAKRLTGFCKLTISETGDGDCPQAPPGFFTAALCSEGESLTSEAFAGRLRVWQNTGVSRVCFLIGGSDGLPQSAKSAAGFLLSLSAMTWPHHMVRAMLLEQIYRAFTILEGGKYHK